MASAAERRRRKRLNRAAAAARAPVPPLVAPVVKPRRRTVTTTTVYAARDNGLDYLLGKNRLNGRQAAAGRTYGVLFRVAEMASGAAIKSCLADLERAAGGAGAGLPSSELGAAEWIADCRMRLVYAQAAVGYHSGMIATLDLICGRGMKPREITPDQRQTEEIETSLRLALDLLDTHFRSDRGGPAG